MTATPSLDLTSRRRPPPPPSASLKMRNVDKVSGHQLAEPQSLVDVENLWNEWQIHCLVLVSFTLQVFLFFVAGVRRRSSSRVVCVLLWLAYMSADYVATFVLGHLAVHAGGQNRQLLLSWAPFVLLHLGGQDTITAFSMQDNELWTRHLLGFATQVAGAVYVVSKSPWPDRLLLAALLLMFLSGCIKYGERTYCLATASTGRLMAEFLSGFKDRIRSIKEMQTIAREGLGSSHYLSSRAFTEFSLNPAMDIMSTDFLPNYDWSVSRDIFSDLYSRRLDPSKPEYSSNAYVFAEERLWICYQRLYTKALFRLSPVGALLHLVAFFSTSAAMALFVMANGKGQLRHYGRADVAVSCVLLLGAITLEVSSFLMSMFSREDLWRHPLCCYAQQLPVIKCVFCMTCGNCALFLRRWRRPQWSETLAQYSIIRRSVKQASGGQLVPPWIVARLRACGVELDTAGTEHIPMTDGLKQFVIKNLLDDKMMLTDFTSSRGEVALERWRIDRGPEGLSSERVLGESLREVDFPTSVLIWHIATEICFFTGEDRASNGGGGGGGAAAPANKTISRQLSNYIMYLVFKSGVMLTSNSEFLLRKAHDEIIHLIRARPGRDDQHAAQRQGNPRDKMAVAVGHLVSSQLFAQARSGDRSVPLNPTTTDILSDPVLPRAFRVAVALDGIRRNRWDLIVAVWLEMFYYIAPRCGAAFHREHLSTGGEFITLVLVLMYIIGPLGYHPSLLRFGSLK